MIVNLRCLEDSEYTSVYDIWYRNLYLHIARSSCSQMFFKKSVFKNIVIFATLWPVTLLKRDSNPGVFLWIFRNYQEQLFSLNFSGCCFCTTFQFELRYTVINIKILASHVISHKVSTSFSNHNIRELWYNKDERTNCYLC